MTTTTLPDRTRLYAALKSKNSDARGAFFVGVTSTGIFCAPGCPARTPKAENCEFFASAAGAMQAGYRACKRCKPLELLVGASEPAWARAVIEHVREKPEVVLGAAELRAMGADPDQASRYFKSRMGVSVQALSRAARVGVAVRWLRHGGSMSAAMSRAGYASESGLRKAVHDVLGVSPGEAARDGAFLSAAWLETQLGPMLAVASDRGLCLLEFVDRRGLVTSLTTLRQRLKMAVVPCDAKEHTHLAAAEKWVRLYFKDARKAGALTLHTPGTAMQERVWAFLHTIACGETRTYSEVAKAIGKASAVRAVAGAVGDNRVAIAVPCHRVVGASGDLTGYAGGVERKAWMLRHEGAMKATKDGEFAWV
jgi:AraC family transcriptional regulator, regulatory protein of adaptative response / methylated-DNA-[protein]-cysteine methyltransferase